MSKHTPGPLEARKGDVFNPERTWGVVRVFSRAECLEIDGDESGYGERTEVVAEVLSADNGRDEADAKLYAAAPELLEAARAVDAEIDFFTRGKGLEGERLYRSEALIALRAAIAKASK